jgi:hypothetical protein
MFDIQSMNLQKPQYSAICSIAINKILSETDALSARSLAQSAKDLTSRRIEAGAYKAVTIHGQV